MTDDPETVADLDFAGIAGVFGPLTSFPFAGPLIALETQQGQRFDGYRRLVPGLVSATVAFALLYPVVDTPFLRLYDIGGQLGNDGLTWWWLPAAVGLGLVGALVGLAVVVLTQLVGSLGGRVVLPYRTLVSGVVIAGAGVIYPLSIFSGRNELTALLDGSGRISLLFLLGLVVVKTLVFGVSLRWGGYGGALFPLLFVGATAGIAIQLATDQYLSVRLPAVLAVATMTAAVTVVVIRMPLTVLVLVIFMFGLDVEAAVLPAIAAVTSFVAVHLGGLKVRVLNRFGTD